MSKFMEKVKKFFGTFTLFEGLLWGGSVLLIVLSFLLFQNKNVLYLIGSLVGATALIFVSKGNVIGQVITLLFSVFYGYVSYTYAYYGEMITYVGMTGPISLVAIFTWLKHPYAGHTEVKVNRLSAWEYVLVLLGGVAVSVGFYFILKAFHTANLILSTLSVYTSFVAVYFSMRRSPFYALAYAFNDVVLVVLWVMASFSNKEYVSMVATFVVFLVNDSYGLINWLKMKKKQEAAPVPQED